MKRLLFIGGVCLIFLIAYLYVAPNLSPQPNYVIGFPTEKSKGRTELLLHHGTKNIATVTGKTDQLNEISRLDFDRNPQQTVYESITNDAIDQHFQPIFGSKDNGKQFSELQETFIDQFKDNEQAATEKGYPKVAIEEKGSITITSMKDERTFSVSELLSDYGKKNDDFFTLDVQYANEDAFLMSMSFSDSSVHDVYHLFMTQDFSKVEVVNGENKAFAEHIASGILDEFSDVLFTSNISERYATLRMLPAIYDKENQDLVEIAASDKLSEDGQYVYLNGDESSFKKGKQQIQRVEDYLNGTKQNIISFKMDFRQIAKEYGLKAVSSTSIAKPIYFNEDYIMYTFSYNAILFGSAGNVNVIVDLQDDPENPTFYLFNFRISS